MKHRAPQFELPQAEQVFNLAADPPAPQPPQRPLMACGHVAQGVDMATGKPVCVICLGINPGADQIDLFPPSLAGREAVCCYCQQRLPSSTDLPFFEHRPKYDTDSFYDGCRGWD